MSEENRTPNDITADPDDRRATYEQDWENMRYQDGLRWSKIQTVAAIEGAYLAAAYVTHLDHARALCVAIFGSILVFIICVLAEKDGRDARVHLKRATRLEADMKIPSIDTPTPVLGTGGHQTMQAAMVVLNLFNVLVVVDLVVKWCRGAA